MYRTQLTSVDEFSQHLGNSNRNNISHSHRNRRAKSVLGHRRMKITNRNGSSLVTLWELLFFFFFFRESAFIKRQPKKTSRDCTISMWGTMTWPQKAGGSLLVVTIILLQGKKKCYMRLKFQIANTRYQPKCSTLFQVDNRPVFFTAPINLALNFWIYPQAPTGV